MVGYMTLLQPYIFSVYRTVLRTKTAHGGQFHSFIDEANHDTLVKAKSMSATFLF